MIPKVIHYCWLSGDPVPENLQNYMKTWREKLPDYEFVLWDKSRFDIHSVKWVEQAYEAKKYAFAADYIRLYALYNYGGIYMDMDVEVRKPFDDILDHPYFFGAETQTGIEGGIFGAEKGCIYIKECLDFYTGREFVNEDGSLNMIGLPKVMYGQLVQQHKIEITPNPDFTREALQVYPFDFFTAKSGDTGVVKPTRNTYTIHHFAGSWLPKSWRHMVKEQLVKMFGENTIRKISSMFQK